MKKFIKIITASALSSALLLNGFCFNTFAVDNNVGVLSVNIQGEGTKASPYLITDESQLTALANGDLSTSADYRLENDIKLKSYDWKPVDNFSGTFDGNGYTISNLKIGTLGSNYSYLGLFGQNSGTIKNLNLEIENINCNGDEDSITGGLVAFNSGTIDNCVVNGNITANINIVGGIVGKLSSGKIQNSYSGCYINGKSSYIGGVVGSSKKSTILKCGFNGKMDDLETYYCGGIVGEMTESNVKDCFNNSIMNINASAVGGVIGYISMITNDNLFIVQNCYNKTNIQNSSDDYTAETGGLIGFIAAGENSIKNCYNLGNITSNTKYVGGLIGYTDITFGNTNVINCYSKGDITGNEYTNYYYTGGLIGCSERSYLNFENCFVVGKITGRYANAVISNNVFHDGYGIASFKNVFYDKSISEVTDNYNVGLSTAEMKNKEAYLNWDFDTVWDINENYNGGYPYLRALGINTSSIKLNKANLTMLKGDTYNLTATITPTNASNKNIIWKSSDKSVAIVNESGVITAIGSGNAEITAITQDGGYIAVCSVNVKNQEDIKNSININAADSVSVPGEIATIPIMVENNSGISSFGINVIYDSNYLTPIEVVDGDVFKDNVANLNYGQNIVRVTNAGAVNKTNNGTLFYLKFKVKDGIDNLNTEIEIQIDQLKTIQGSNTIDTEYFVKNGNLQIKNIILGDVDDDSQVTANDATEILMNYALLKEFNSMQKASGDVDGDGEITANDATQVLFKYAGFDVEW